MTGIVVVTWNSAEVIRACLDACLRLPDVQVAVVDNASSDETVAEVRKRPEVRLVANATNRGFAGGVNQGIEMLDCPAVLILNPDAVPVAGFELLATAALRAGVGAAGGTLLDTAGVPQHGFNVRQFPTPWTLAFEVLGLNKLLPFNPVNRRYRMIDGAAAVRESPHRPRAVPAAHSVTEPRPSGSGSTTPARLSGERVPTRSRALADPLLHSRGSEAIDVDQPAGAFLMVNRAAWAAVGGFDEGFHPVWFEDVDFCLRLKKTGYRIVYVPNAGARHIGGHSAARVRWDQRQVFWYGNLLRYAGLHFPPVGRRLVSVAVMLGVLVRASAALVFRGRLTAVSVYSEILRLACRCWSKGQCLSDLQAARLSRKERKAPLY